MKRNHNNIALYVRVSTQEQAKEGYSIEEQEDRLKSYCKAMGWKEYKIYKDAGYSGGNMDRPGLQEILHDIQDNLINKVVVYKLDRLSRSQKDTLILIEDEFLANGVDFVSMSENFDTSTPFGRAMVGILAVFAQLEREQIKERLSMGREARAKEGKWIGVGNAPIGYDYENDLLTINEYEAMQIRELFRMYISGISPRIIATIFNDKGYNTRYGKWYERKVVTILTNKLYIGYVEFNKQYYKGIHDPIITEEEFEKAQHEIELRKRSNLPSAPQSTLLGGLIYCKRCGARYGIYTSGKYKYYACHSRRKRNLLMIKDPNCMNKTYRLNTLDNIILDEIKKLALEPDQINKIRNESQSSKRDIEQKSEILEAEITKLNKQRKRYLELYGLGDYTYEELHDVVGPLQEQIDKLYREIDLLSSYQPDLTTVEAREIISDFTDVVEQGNNEELKLIVTSLINKIEIDGEDITIYWRFA